MRKIPIIIDCDPGVDDSYAIALANSFKNVEIVAICAVEGNVPAVTTRYNALCLSDTFDMKTTKVSYGAVEPLVKPYFSDPSGVHGEGGIGGIVLPTPTKVAEEKPAWDVIYEEAVLHSGELILFAVGPLTNIAIALRKYPDLPTHLKQFVIMGGGTFGNIESTGNTAEFNIWVDPTAAKEVFEKMVVYMVGLDATHAAYLEDNDFDNMIEITSNSKNKQTHFLHQLSKFSKRNSFEEGCDNNIIHDALAIASALEKDIVEFKKCFVTVEDKDVVNNGQTFIDFNHKNTNCYFATNINRNKFIQVMKKMCQHYAKL